MSRTRPPSSGTALSLSGGLHVSRVEVRNYRNFDHLVLDPFPPRAVIVGENGVGKSNLLAAMRLVLDPSLSEVARTLRPEDVWDGHPAGLPGGATVSVTVDLTGFDDDEATKAVLGDCLVGVDPYVARLNYRFAPTVPADGATSGEDAAEGEPRLPLTPGDYEAVVYGRDDEMVDVRRARKFVSMRVLPALRDAEGDLRTWRTNPLRSLVEELAIDPDALKRTAEGLRKAAAGLSAEPEVDDLEDRLESRLSAMAGPRLDIDPTLGFASSREDELLRSVRLFVDAARTRSVADASLGSANVLYLSLLLETLGRSRRAGRSVAVVVGVEEPEAHLHPTLQRRLFGYLLREEPSLILTTHSPHIAAVTPLTSFVALVRPANGTASVGRTTAGLLLTTTQRQDLERYVDVSRAEVLFASAVVLVEGTAEVYLLPALARAAGFDLDEHGVVVTSVSGTDFAPYAAFLGRDGLQIPTFVVTDGDQSATSTGRVTDPGLLRAARLLPAGRTRTDLVQRCKDLPDEANDASARAAVVADLSDRRLFVGLDTLETDVCGLLGDLLVDAYAELRPRSRVRLPRVRTGVANERTATPDPVVRARMLEDVDDVGKGRLAQRLAAHVEEMDLADEVRGRLGLAPGDAVAGFAPMGRSAYLLACLDAVSEEVRGHELFPATS